MSDKAKTPIPEGYRELGRELAILARRYGLDRLTATVTPGQGWHPDGVTTSRPAEHWPADIQYEWHTGRHGDEEGRIMLASTVRAIELVDLLPPKEMGV